MSDFIRKLGAFILFCTVIGLILAAPAIYASNANEFTGNRPGKDCTVSIPISMQNYQVQGNVMKEGSSNGVSNANIEFTNTSSSQKSYCSTDGSGYYQISLSEGQSASGYQDYSYSSQLAVFSNFNQNFNMKANSGSDGSSDNPFNNISMPDGMEPLIFIGVFFCLGIPIALIIISIVLAAIFVRMGKVRKELTKISDKVSAPAPAATQPLPSPPQTVPPLTISVPPKEPVYQPQYQQQQPVQQSEVYSQPKANPQRGSSTDRLEELKNMKDKGLITEQDYESKRKQILDGL
jgi:hypothetical protein